ncbi:MAG TPA: S-methyl-5-thioribose kinase [Sulfurovum sp.]|nr:S-methyl-5-thioribose kinase [Sulfurovum sp.]
MYKILNNDTIRDYVDEVPEIRDLLLGSEESIAKLEISEIGDGNLNFVYIVKAGDRSVILKQAVPYLRCVGEEYPLSRIRMTFEIEALKTEKEICPEFVPDIYYSSHDMSLVVMQNLNQHKILRAEMINRVQFPLLSEHISTFLADTLFFTSDLYLKSDAKKEGVAKFINIELCKITEDFIFTHPYEDNETNEYNPKLDMALVKKFREDKDVKMAVLGMKYKFMTNAQALLHGDLHSGSIMLNQKETFVIDPEFAFYGPIAFDVGIYLANLIMSYLSLDGDDNKYGGYVSAMIVDTWDMFSTKFKENMISHEKESKSLQFDYPNGLVCLEGYANNFMDDLFEDSIGFVACEMFRRTVGLAKVADIAGIEDLDKRAKIEARVLDIASVLIKNKSEINDIAEVLAIVKAKSQS